MSSTDTNGTRKHRINGTPKPSVSAIRPRSIRIRNRNGTSRRWKATPPPSPGGYGLPKSSRPTGAPGSGRGSGTSCGCINV
ncbi:hypothetical protein ACFYYN_10385, partial [Streptomyces sp. NPDC001902]